MFFSFKAFLGLSIFFFKNINDIFLSYFIFMEMTCRYWSNRKGIARTPYITIPLKIHLIQFANHVCE